MFFLRYLFVLVLLCSYGMSKSLKIGVLPYTDPLKILIIYQPMKQFLEEELKQNVEIYSSNSYESFFEDTRKNQFDIVVTGPHFGYIHLKDHFKPLFRYDTDLKPIFIVLKESPYKEVKDLKNKKISMSNYLSVSSMGGIKALMDEGFRNNKEFTLINSSSHASAIMSVVLGDVDAAITTYTPLKQLTDESIKNKIRYFESDFAMPHLFTIANPNFSNQDLKIIKNGLLKFEQSKSGKEFFVKTGYKGYTQITKQDLEKMKPIIEETKGYLKIK